MQKFVKHWSDWFIIAAMAALMALSYAVFVFPNSFAPAGINGIITMIQYLLHIDIGYLVFSGVSLLLRNVDLSGIRYHTDNGTSLILGPIAAGAISGFIYGVVLARNGSTGGMDLIAAWVRSKRPEAGLVWVIFCLNASVAAISFFVYGYKFEPVIMCIIYCYVSSRISDTMLRGSKRALKFEVVTDRAEELSEVLLRQMHHGVTVVPAEGMFSKQEKKLLVCIVNRHQIVQFQQILARFPGSFSYVSEVTETMGNFKKIRH